MNRECSDILKRISTELPQFDIGKRRGSTDYIDFLKYNEVKENLMGGRDSFNRVFIVAKGIATLKDKSTIPFFQTFFQRYTRDDQLWVACNGLFSYQGGIDVNQKKSLIELFTTKKLDCTGKKQGVLRLLVDDVESINL